MKQDDGASYQVLQIDDLHYSSFSRTRQSICRYRVPL